MVVLKLGAGPFQKSMVIEELQSPQHLQRTVANKRDDLAGTQKPVSVNKPDDGAVAFRELHGGNGGALKAGKSFFHSATMAGMMKMRETLEFASGASFIVLPLKYYSLYPSMLPEQKTLSISSPKRNKRNSQSGRQSFCFLNESAEKSQIGARNFCSHDSFCDFSDSG